MADEEKTKSEPRPPRFKITNVVRRVNSRICRAVAPGRRRFKQFVCGKRLLRKQSIWVTPEEMERHEAQLFAQVCEGAIEITTPDGVVISADVHGRLIGRKGMEIIPMDSRSKRPVEKPLKEVPTEPESKMEVKTSEEVELEPALSPPVPDSLSEKGSPAQSGEAPKMDDLTELPGVGAGRARKLEAAGITTFKQIAEMSPGALVKVLGSSVTEDQAADICDAASEKEG